MTNEGKINAIRKWPTPTTITEVQSFLGFAGYYHQFIPKFMKVAWPMHELMSSENAGKKKVAITWNNRCQRSFDDLKHLCTMAPILACANFMRPFKLHTNVCRSDDGTDAVIAYASRSLTHYPVHKLEFLILKWAVVEYLYGLTFHVYITGTRVIGYTLISSCQPPSALIRLSGPCCLVLQSSWVGNTLPVASQANECHKDWSSID